MIFSDYFLRDLLLLSGTLRNIHSLIFCKPLVVFLIRRFSLERAFLDYIINADGNCSESSSKVFLTELSTIVRFPCQTVLGNSP